MQDEYECFVFIPDYHALISVQNQEQLANDIIQTTIDLLAVGIDPDKTVLYKQSDLPHHTELTWIFNCLVTMPQLMRGHAFKDSEAKSREVSVGLFDYPVLQAADIVLYDADVVPVGEDQVQHIEMAREIARKFNNTFGSTFKEPQALIRKEVGTIVGSDGQKMSKSYGNTLPLFASEDETMEFIKKIPMDSKAIDEIKNPDEYALYKIAEPFLTSQENKELRAKFENGGVGYRSVKEEVYTIINDYLRPIRENREKHIDYESAKKVLKAGAEKARLISEPKINDVRYKIGLVP